MGKLRQKGMLGYDTRSNPLCNSSVSGKYKQIVLEAVQRISCARQSAELFCSVFELLVTIFESLQTTTTTTATTATKSEGQGLT